MEIAVISGKGGTGKSCFSASLATLSEKVVLGDCDVDAANLYIIFDPSHEEVNEFAGSSKAIIDSSICTNCGICISYCSFEAISLLDNRVIINDLLCDGCRLCSRICPASAISIVINKKSRMYSGSFRNGRMVYGRLAPGEENSGKLVNIVREKAKNEAIKYNLKIIILDGPPGIGCPVISTITGADRVVIVTEPTLSAISDLKRIIKVVIGSNLPVFVVINKYDMNADITRMIEESCGEQGIVIAGKLPFDDSVVQAMVNCKSMIEWSPDSIFSHEVLRAFNIIVA